MIDLEQLIRAAVSAELDKRGLKPANDSSDYLTVAEYAARWSLSPSTVRHAIRDRRLAVIRVGRAIRIAASAVIGPAVADNTAQARLRLMRSGR